MSNAVIGWAKDNPLAAGAAVVGVLVVVMLATGGSSQAADTGGAGSAGVAAYYAAVAQQSQAGAAIQIAEVQANAGTNQALIAATYGLETAKVWAPVSENANDNAAALQADQQQKNFDLANAALQSNERLEADAHKVQLNMATLNYLGVKQNAKASQPTGFAQGVNAVSGLAKTIGSFF